MRPMQLGFLAAALAVAYLVAEVLAQPIAGVLAALGVAVALVALVATAWAALEIVAHLKLLRQELHYRGMPAHNDGPEDSHVARIAKALRPPQ